MPDTVLYDGHCGLCSRFVRLVKARDARGCFRFLAQSSAEGQELLQRTGLAGVDSVVLIEAGRACARSRAVQRILQGIGYRWTARVLGWVPVPLADAVYGFVARHRLLWFKEEEQCRWSS